MISQPQTPQRVEDKTKPKLHGLDHLRAFAISFVFFYHYVILSGGQPTWLAGFARFGWTGVDLFFVLSGFLIASQLFAELNQQERIAFKRFFQKRFFRIIPAYIVTVGLYFGVSSFREKEQLPPLWKFLTFTQNFGLNLKDYGAFSHAWSLCVEEHFYVLLPLTLLIFQSLNRFSHSVWLLLFLYLAGFAARVYSFTVLYAPHGGDETSWLYWYKYVYYPTYNRLDGLLVGVSIAIVYTFLPRVWHKMAKRGNQFMAGGIVLLLNAFLLCEAQQSFVASVFGFPLVAISYGLIVVGAVSPTSYLYRWQSKATALVATLSYAIYLTHKMVIHVTHSLLDGFNADSSLLLLVCVMTTLSIALFLNIVVEKPFLSLRNRFMKKAKIDY